MEQPVILDSFALISFFHVDKIRFVRKLGHLSVDILVKVDRALKLHYELS